MTDFLDGLERDLVAAAERRNAARRAAVGVRRRRLVPRAPGSFLLAAVLCTVTAAAAAGGTLTILRGSPIPAPAVRDAGASQTPAAGTVRLADVRAEDPVEGPSWALRLAGTRTGALCSTVGQLVDGEFGLIGLDGRFRLVADRVVDGCGQPASSGTSYVGVRVFDADRVADVRSLVNGVAGEQLRGVTVEAGGRRVAVPVGEGGAFLAALRGYPEDLALGVELRFADGRIERRPFGTASFVVPDPVGGRAWKAQATGFGNDDRLCISFRPARESGMPTISPAACGRYPDPRRRRGYFFAARRIEPGTGGLPYSPSGDGNWGRHPARTAIWGSVGEDIASATITGPGRGERDVAIGPARTILAVYPPSVDPATLTVRLTRTDGRIVEARGDTNLVASPLPPKSDRPSGATP